jgi:hypothetical protein
VLRSKSDWLRQLAGPVTIGRRGLTSLGSRGGSEATAGNLRCWNVVAGELLAAACGGVSAEATAVAFRLAPGVGRSSP